MSAHAPHPPAAHAVPLLVAAGGASLPMLPPRPTGLSYPTEPTAPGWRSWPVLVIILATVAIVAAVVLMVWPALGGRGDLDGKHSMSIPPAPERMQTEPDVRSQPPSDPQAVPKPSQPGATRDPGADPADQAPADPNAGASAADDDDPDVDGQSDPLASPQPRALSVPPNRRPLPVNGNGVVLFAIAEHMCRKLDQCGTDDPIGRRACDRLSPRAVTPPTGCPAANRCLLHIDTLSCGSMDVGLSQLTRLLNQVRDCTDAIRC